MKYLPIAGVLAAAIVALAGCGTDSSTGPSDTAPPLAPQLTAGYCKGPSRVILAWAPNGESDLAGYNIYIEGLEYPVGSVDRQARSTALFHQPQGEVTYYLTAVDQAGNESAPSSPMIIHVAPGPGPVNDNFFELR